MPASLTIRGARLVLPDRVVRGDLVVVDGVIDGIGPTLEPRGDVVDADGLVVLPGLVDTLVDVPLGDDGTALARVSGEAAAWGITSLLLHDPAEPGDRDEVHRRHLEHAAHHCRVHFGVYAAPAADGTLPDTDRAPGVRVRVGAGSRGGLPLELLDRVVERCARVVVVDGLDPEGARAADEGAWDDEPARHGERYPPGLAATVVRRAVHAARLGGCVHLPRVASREELAALAPAGELGVDVSAGTDLPHLFLAGRAGRLGRLGVCDPPLRDAADVAALWEALRSGVIGVIASGHGSVRLADKDVPYPATPGALPTVGATLPLLLRALADGHLALPDVARWTADAPARRFGLARAGRLEVGFDADVVLVDPDADASATPPVPSWSGWSPLAGLPACGRVVTTLLRGRPVWRDGALVDGVRGRELVFPLG